VHDGTSRNLPAWLTREAARQNRHGDPATDEVRKEPFELQLASADAIQPG
jgi:hypothetical protein